MKRKRRWPSIDLYQDGGTGAIKTATAAELEHLMTKAADNHWSAIGRPAWFAEHRAEFAEAFVVAFGPEGAKGVYRCVTTVLLQDTTGGYFSLDMWKKDFDALNDLSRTATVLAAHRYLMTFPHIPVP